MRNLTSATVLSLLLGLTGTTIADAQGQPKQTQPAPAAPQAGWQNSVTKDAGAPGSQDNVMSPQQVATMAKVNAYFNDLNTMKGTFQQTDPDRKKTRGKFYVKRPGMFRFDYGATGKKTVVSDGQYLAIQDPDLASPDTYELDNTPFRLLLRKDVDLIRDARILDVQETEDLITTTLQDKSPDAPGRIQLFLAKKPVVELKEWVVIDVQGLETRVEVADINRTEDIDSGLFRRENSALKRLQ